MKMIQVEADAQPVVLLVGCEAPRNWCTRPTILQSLLTLSTIVSEPEARYAAKELDFSDHVPLTNGQSF